MTNHMTKAKIGSKKNVSLAFRNGCGVTSRKLREGSTRYKTRQAQHELSKAIKYSGLPLWQQIVGL